MLAARGFLKDTTAERYIGPIANNIFPLTDDNFLKIQVFKIIYKSNTVKKISKNNMHLENDRGSVMTWTGCTGILTRHAKTSTAEIYVFFRYLCI